MSDPAAEFMEAFQSGTHIFQQLEMVTLPGPDDEMTIELTCVGPIRNNRGALQGGLVATLVDVVAGQLAWRHAPEGRQVATADMNIHYLAPVMVGPARATAKVARAGKRMIVLSVEVTDADNDRLCAISTATFSVLDARPGQLAPEIGGLDGAAH